MLSMLLQGQRTASRTVATDAELLRSVAKRECEFASLVDRYGRLVWNTALRQARDCHVAEDVFQATFLALWQHAHRLHTRTSLGGWLHTVAFRLARKARQRIRLATLECHPAATCRLPLDKVSAADLFGLLEAELVQLPERFRAPLLLCCWEGLTRDEAAARLGCSVGSLKGRLERAETCFGLAYVCAALRFRRSWLPALLELRRPVRCKPPLHRVSQPPKSQLVWHHWLRISPIVLASPLCVGPQQLPS